jgi:hypothetical protein
MRNRSTHAVYPAVREDLADRPTRHVDHLGPFLFLNPMAGNAVRPIIVACRLGPSPSRFRNRHIHILKATSRTATAMATKARSAPAAGSDAGRGMAHSETSSPDFKQRGGPLEL